MRLGAHESAAGGCDRIWERCDRDGAEAVQLWTRSSRQWASRDLPDEEVARFRRDHRRHGGGRRFPTAAHASYLINLAAPGEALWERSIATLTDECRRAERLGLQQVIFHPGAAQGSDRDRAIERVCRGLDRVRAALGPTRVRLVVEITAGQGTSVGCSFEDLGAIVEGTRDRRLGVCLDTQHMFAAGIDWTTAEGYAKTFADFDRLVGLRRLVAFHLNDSKRPLGARVDRHAIIGEGLIGLEPFRRLVNDPRFAELPGYLETPPLPSGEESYAACLRLLMGLRASRR